MERSGIGMFFIGFVAAIALVCAAFFFLLPKTGGFEFKDNSYDAVNQEIEQMKAEIEAEKEAERNKPIELFDGSKNLDIIVYNDSGSLRRNYKGKYRVFIPAENCLGLELDRKEIYYYGCAVEISLSMNQ